MGNRHQFVVCDHARCYGMVVDRSFGCGAGLSRHDADSEEANAGTTRCCIMIIAICINERFRISVDNHAGSRFIAI
jgi:hypothetical protein